MNRLVILPALVFALSASGCGAGAICAAAVAADFIADELDSEPRPGHAVNLTPADGARSIPLTVELAWVTAKRAKEYRVHVSADASPAFYETTTDNTSLVTGLALGTTYYWRIDASGDGGTTKGCTWSFRTVMSVPDNASGPVPADGAVDVSANQVLGWADSESAEGYYVYFGTENPPSYAAYTTDNSHDPGGLMFLTTYYWRIIPSNLDGNASGPLWSFTTTVGGLDNSAWPCFGGNDGRTGLAAVAGSADNSVLWVAYLENGSECSLFSSPAIGSGGRVYVGCQNGYLYALDASNGSEIWKYDAGASIYSSPAVSSSGVIYVGSDASKLHAVNSDGSEKWTFPTGDYVISSPVIGPDGVVYFGSDDYNVYAVRPNGTEKWHFPTSGWVDSSPALANAGEVLYAASRDGKLYAIHASNGSEIWRCNLGDEVLSSPAVGTDGTIYIGSRDFNLYAVNASGNVKWAYELYSFVDSSPAIGPDGTVYVACLDNFIYAVDSLGNGVWQFETDNSCVSSPAVDNAGVVYVGSGDGHVYAIDNGSKLWSRDLGNPVDSSPAIGADGTVYVGAENGRLYAIRKQD